MYRAPHGRLLIFSPLSPASGFFFLVGGRGGGLIKRKFPRIYYFISFWHKFRNVEDVDTAVAESNPKPPLQEVRIVTVVCGERVTDTLAMIKSALIMSSSMIKFILFADEDATILLKRTVTTWSENVLKRMQLDLRPITFPVDKAEEWKMLFKPCATQRLFLPVSLNTKYILKH